MAAPDPAVWYDQAMNGTQAPLYTAARVREFDRRAIEIHGIPGFTLMQRAGESAWHALLAYWPEVQQLEIFCGTGNNGGDGFILAALAIEAGVDVHVWLAGPDERIRGDARSAYELALSRQVPVNPAADFSACPLPDQQCVIVDALLGTGLSGEVRGGVLSLIDLINNSELPVLAIDIPSGLCSDTGRVLGKAVHADATVTFIGRKTGQFSGAGPAHCGRLYFSDLGVPAAVFDSDQAPGA